MKISGSILYFWAIFFACYCEIYWLSNMFRPKNFILASINRSEPSCISRSFVWVIHNNFCQICKDTLYQLLEYWLPFAVHWWTWIDFNKPNFKIFIDHKIVSIKLKWIFSIFNHILNTHSWSFDLLFDLRPNNLFIQVLLIREARWEIWIQMTTKIFRWPNVI